MLPTGKGGLRCSSCLCIAGWLSLPLHQQCPILTHSVIPSLLFQWQDDGFETISFTDTPLKPSKASVFNFYIGLLFISFHFPFIFEMLRKLYSSILVLPSQRFQVHGLFFSFIAVTCMCIYICIPKYSILSLNDITCILVFRVNHLVLNNQLVLSFLGKMISPFLIISQVPVVLSVMLKSFPRSLWHAYCYQPF